MKSLAVADRYGYSRYIANQAYYSLIGRDYEWEQMPLGLDQGVGAVVWSPLGWGRLTGKIRRGQPLPATSRLHKTGDVGPQMSDEYLYCVVDALDEVAAETGKSVPQIALNWLLQRPTVSTVALLGVVLVVLTSGKDVKVEPMAALVLVSVVACSIFFVGQKPLFARNTMLGVTGFTFFAGTLGALPFGLGLPQALVEAPASHIGALVWLGIAPTFIGYIAWNAALHRAPASQVSSFIYFSPPIAVLIGWVWLGERPTLLTLVGGVITVGGVVLANARRRAPAAAPVVATPAKQS